MDRVVTLVLTGLALLVAPASGALQEGPSERMVRAFDASILFMLIMPFALVAIVGGALYYLHRKRDRAGEE